MAVDQPDYAQAEALYRRALAIMEARLGPSHPSLVTCRQNYDRLVAVTGATVCPRQTPPHPVVSAA